jgi:hypothetical protein
MDFEKPLEKEPEEEVSDETIKKNDEFLDNLLSQGEKDREDNPEEYENFRNKFHFRMSGDFEEKIKKDRNLEKKEEEEKIREIFRFFIEDMLKREPADPYNDDTADIIQADLKIKKGIAQIIGEEEPETTRGWYDKDSLFFDELIKISKNLSPEQRKGLDWNLYKFLDYYNPGTNIGTTEMLVTTAKITRIPEFQGNIGQSLIGELNYRINWTTPEVLKDIEREIEDASTAEKMDMLEIIKSVVAKAASMDWPNGIKHIKNIIEHIKTKDNSFFVQIYLEKIQERIQSEEKEPSQGIVGLSGDRARSRLAEPLNKLEKENYELTSSLFKPDRIFNRQERMMRISEDMLVIMDHSNNILSLAKTPKESFEREPLATKPKDLMKLQDTLQAQEKEMGNEMQSYLFLNQIIVFASKSSIMKNEYKTIEELANIWEKTCGKLSIPWIDILTNLKNIIPLSIEEKSAIIKGLNIKAEEIFKEQEGNVPDLDFVSYEDITKKYNYILNDTEENDETFLLLQHLYKPEIISRIEKKLEINKFEIPFNYQLHLLKFLTDKNETEVDKVKEFLNGSINSKEKTNRIKSFLAMESGEKMGESIFKISEKAEPEFSEKVFEKYANITDQIENSKELIASMLKQQNADDDEIRSINSNLIVKANRMIADFAQELDKNTKEDNIKEKLLRKLDRYQEDLMLTASVYKTLKKESGRDIRIEDIKDIQLQTKNATEIKDEELQQMLDIYGKNYDNRPEFKNQLLEIFKNKIKENRQDTVLYVIKKGNQIIAFNRFDRNPDETKYFGSFNVDPNMQDSSIGTALFEESLRIESGDSKPIKATCDAFSTATIMYIEKGGFVVTDIIPEPGNETGEKIFQIEKSDVIESKYKEIPQKEIIRMQEDEEQKENSIILKLGKNPKEISNAVEDLINNKKYLLTRYFCDKERTNVYCVLEKS